MAGWSSSTVGNTDSHSLELFLHMFSFIRKWRDTKHIYTTYTTLASLILHPYPPNSVIFQPIAYHITIDVKRLEHTIYGDVVYVLVIILILLVYNMIVSD